jgi:hypothetical protein
VTLDGKPVKAGYIDFMPEDSRTGQTAGAKITNGTYSVKDMIPGKMRVTVRVNAADPQKMQQLRKEMAKWAHAQGSKMQRPPFDVTASLQSGSPGRGETHEIASGSQVLNLDLKSAK